MDGQPDGRPKNIMPLLPVVGGGIKIICDKISRHAVSRINFVK